MVALILASLVALMVGLIGFEGLDGELDGCLDYGLDVGIYGGLDGDLDGGLDGGLCGGLGGDLLMVSASCCACFIEIRSVEVLEQALA